MKAVPYLRLPSRVVAFDGSLETGFSGRSKDRGTPQAQTEKNQPSQSVAELVSALEASVVIELGVSRQAKDFPVLDHGLDRRTSKDSAIWPRSNQTAMRRYSVEDLDVDSTFDDVEAIKFTTPLGHLRQIPTHRRWWVVPSPPTIESLTPLQDAPDGTYSRDGHPPLGKQFSLDCLGPVLAQDAFSLEFSADSHNQVFNIPLRAMDTMRSVRAILPVDPLHSFPRSSRSPVIVETLT
jgi:hypothetical protein